MIQEMVSQKMAYSVQDVAKQTTLSISTVRNEIRVGNLKARKIGQRVLVLEEDLRNYLRGENGSETIN